MIDLNSQRTGLTLENLISKINKEAAISPKQMNFIDQDGQTVMCRVALYLKRALEVLYNFYEPDKPINQGIIMLSVMNNLSFIQYLMLNGYKFTLFNGKNDKSIRIGEEDGEKMMIFSGKRNGLQPLIISRYKRCNDKLFRNSCQLSSDCFETGLDTNTIDFDIEVRFYDDGCWKTIKTTERKHNSSYRLCIKNKFRKHGSIISWKTKEPDNSKEAPEENLNKEQVSTELDILYPFKMRDSSINYPLIIEQVFKGIYESAQQTFNQYNKK